MQVQAINYYSDKAANTKIGFKSLIKDPSALPIINKMSKADILELKKIERKLSRTKFWDLKILGIGKQFEEFKFNFISKANNKNIITEGIFPYKRSGNTINFHSIVYCPENVALSSADTLKFKTEKKAKELYNKYQRNIDFWVNKHYKLTPIESLKIKEIELKMLDEASKITDGIYDSKKNK